MATVQNTPVTSPEVIDDGSKTIDNLQTSYELNKSRINTIAIALVVIVGGYFAYTQLYKAPQEKKAASMMYHAEHYFTTDSFSKALNGDGQFKGFSYISKNYGGTPSGNLARYYAGISYLKLGQFKEAIKELEDFDGKGTIVESVKFGALGDAYMETGNTAKGIESYKKASSNKDDFAITPLYLFRLGLAYEMNNQLSEAKDVYKRIKTEYPASAQAQDMDKYLARLGEI